MLEVVDITKKFGELVALDGVSFKTDGGCLGIIGPNGAGKTTLFSIISGFQKPTSGRIVFNGVDITGMRPSKIARLGLVRTFQLLKTFRHMSVYENISVVSDNVREILERVGLWDKRHHLAANLSQGEMRRLGIAIAIATNPKMLLLDEPFSGLSPAEGRMLGEMIEELKNDGISIVIIEHRLGELFNLVDRVLVLNFGKVIFEGHPDDAVNDKTVIEAYLGNGVGNVEG
jgi:branched-chain amino acid transport system ATP-binding protein